MDILSNLALGFEVAFSLNNVLYCLVGALLGTFIGVLPGVGPLVTIAVLLPLTFGIPAESALIMLAGIYYGAQYGGSTTAILVNLPGESSSVVTCLDGHAMAKQGRAGAALAIAAIGSLFAGCVGTVLIALVAPALASVALKFQSPEYFSLAVMALCCTTALVHGSIVRGLAMAMVGILCGLVGVDVNSGTPRFTFDFIELLQGIDFAVAAMGLFAFAEIVSTLENPERRQKITSHIKGLMPTREDLAASWKAIVRGTALGSVLGVLPGAGASISSFLAYILERKVSRTPERFGHGAIEGVAGPEAANNAAAQTSFIPTLTLGVPGTATMALFLGALMIQGISPGPAVMSEHPRLFWGLVASMWLGNVMLLIINLPLVGIWVKLLQVPYNWLFPLVLVCSCLGVYSLNNDASGIYLAAIFGLAGWVFRKLDCEPAPLILGFVLGPMIEENMRRALTLSGGDPAIFVTRPISGSFLLVAVLAVTWMLIGTLRAHRGPRDEAEAIALSKDEM